MSFIHPLLAWGALLGSIPIIIHILSRRRYKVIRWAATDFLLQALSERSRNVRIQDLILLALRTLALMLAAWVVARPVLSPAAAEKTGIHVRGPDAVIVLDTSYSMSTTMTAQSRLALAKRRAHDVLAAMTQGSAMGVVYMDQRGTSTTPGLIADRVRIGVAIDAAEPCASGSDAESAVAAALEMLAGSTAARKRVYLITDAQACTFETSADALRKMLAKADDSIGFVVLTVPNGPTGNCAVTDFQIRNRWLSVGSPLQFEARISDVGQPVASEVTAELWVDGRRVDRKAVAISDREAVATFEHTFTAAGVFAVEVRLEPDSVEIDNHRFAAVCIAPAIEVAVVASEPDAGPSAHTFIAAALDRQEDAERTSAGPPFVVGPRLSPEQLGTGFNENVWAVILADPGALSADALAQLDALVERGGAVVIAVGSEAASTLGSFRSADDGAGRWLTDLSYALPSDTTDALLRFDVSSLSDDVIDLNSPGVRESVGAVLVFKAISVETNGESQWSTAMRLDDGRPALITRGIGDQGRLALLCTSLDPQWCDLVYRPAMVPVLQDLLLWSVWHRLVAPTLLPGQVWSPTVADKIILPNGETLATAAFLATDESTGHVSIQFDRTDRPGVYRLGGLDRHIDDALSTAVVNIDTTESDQSVWTPSQIKSLFPSGRCEVLSGGAGVDAIALAGLSGSEIWSVLAAVLGFLLLVEAFLAFRFSLSQRSRDVPGGAA